MLASFSIAYFTASLGNLAKVARFLVSLHHSDMLHNRPTGPIVAHNHTDMMCGSQVELDVIVVEQNRRIRYVALARVRSARSESECGRVGRRQGRKNVLEDGRRTMGVVSGTLIFVLFELVGALYVQWTEKYSSPRYVRTTFVISSR